MGKIKHSIGNLVKNMNQDLYDDIQDFLMLQTYKKRKRMDVSEYPVQLKNDYEKYHGGGIRLKKS